MLFIGASQLGYCQATRYKFSLSNILTLHLLVMRKVAHFWLLTNCCNFSRLTFVLRLTFRLLTFEIPLKGKVLFWLWPTFLIAIALLCNISAVVK